MKLSSYLSDEVICLDSKAGSAEEVCREMAGIMANAGLAPDSEMVFRKIMDREKLGTTGIGEGIAMPHAHMDVPDVGVAFLRTATPLDFGALDGKPCRLFFMVISPKSKQEEYLKVMAALACLLKHKQVQNSLLAARSAKDVVDMIRKEEVVNTYSCRL